MATIGSAVKESLGVKIETGLKRALAFRESGVLIALLFFFTAMWVVSPTFRTPFNLTTILKQISVTAIMAMGQTLVVIAGAFDLSQAPVAGLAAMSSALAWKNFGLDPALAICVGLAVGTLCGFVNGLLAARFRLHPIVMTLATSTVFSGFNYFITRGETIVGLPEGLTWLGQGDISGISVPILVMLIISLLMHLMLTRTLFGLRILMIGGNLKATTDIGIDVAQLRVGVFTISGFLAGLGGIVLLGRVGNAIPQIGQSMLFPVVTATILGGTLLTGGVGSMAGTLIGAAIMGIVNNALAILQFSVYLQDMSQGALVVMALLVDQFRRGELTWKMIVGRDR
ncbi:MAG: ABC transporter permease [Chloroflexi bacterium]|nr:ABC transporter permease [Chloroflexota bacterium]